MDFRPVFVCLLFVTIPVLGTTTKYMDTHCSLTTTIYESAFLRMTTSHSTMRDPCIVTVKASSSTNKLVVKFDSIDLRCLTASLDIFDGRSTSAPRLKAACGSFELSVTSSGRYLTFKYQKTGFGTFDFSSFKILLTEFHEGICLGGEYSCLNDRCISNRLKCDGHDNCGDDSDELFGCSLLGGTTYYGWGTGLRVGVGIGVTVFIVVVISVVVGLYRRRLYINNPTVLRNGTTVMTTQHIPPSVNVQMAPTQFQQMSVPQVQNMAPTQFQYPAQPPPYPGK